MDREAWAASVDSDRTHFPVLIEETVDGLGLNPGDDVIDGTVGAGGHAAAILEKTAPDGRLLGLDLDEAALETARKRVAPDISRVMLVRASYRDIATVVASHRFESFQAALLDLGYSSMEIDDPARGFSFRADGPLDMRFDRSQELTAADLLNTLTPEQISLILAKYGEERYCRRIAQAIIKERKERPLESTEQLVSVISRAVPAVYRRGKTHFATRTFQALRIAVNDELGNVEAALPEMLNQLASGGRLAVISFHSLEDRIVKRYFKREEREGLLKILTKRPITATEEELKENPRSRSAKLRIAEKI